MLVLWLDAVPVTEGLEALVDDGVAVGVDKTRVVSGRMKGWRKAVCGFMLF